MWLVRKCVVQGATQGDVLVLWDLTKVNLECWVGGFHWSTNLSQGPALLPGIPRAEDTSCQPPMYGDSPPQ